MGSLFLMIMIAGVFAYADNESTSSIIDAKEQKKIIVKFQQLLKENYVLEEKIPLLTNGLADAVEAGLYDKPQSQSDFVAETNRILQASFADRHLSILAPEKFSRMMEMFGSSDDRSPQPGPQHAQGHSPKTGNHETRKVREKKGMEALREIAGITRVSEINRDGLNQVGYIAFEHFIHSPKAEEIIDNIFHSFTESERIILDLRECRGGDAGIVKYLSDYFFEEPTHLVSSMVRGGETRERWTKPNPLSPIFAGKKLDILVSPTTFSAGESFSFGMKQIGRARLLGRATGGGGHMNDFFPLSSGFGASISVGRTYDPRTGEGWEAKGVTPHIVFEEGHALSGVIDLITEESGKLDEFSEEQLKVYRALQGYTHAWYNAEADKMKELISSGYQASYANTGSVQKRNYQQQLTATKQGQGVLERLFHNRIIRNIAVSEDEAHADLILRETTHKIRLIKTESGWEIDRDDYHDKALHG